MSEATSIGEFARAFFSRLRNSREEDEQQARENRHLREALHEEKLEGHRIATIARTIALTIIALLLPFLNPTWSVLYYEALLAIFIIVGWLQWRVSKFGQSRNELLLILCDLSLLTFIGTMPNPFVSEPIPAAFVYQFDTFLYFFVFLSTATLAFSWRTVWAIGVWTSLMWVFALALVVLVGRTMPEITAALQAALPDAPLIVSVIDPNNAHLDNRAQEVVVFLIVAGILALKSWRSNQLLVRQAGIAAERANLSRYFPPNMVDMLASSEHDAGAVRSQDIAVLFTDIVGFTEIAEKNPPEMVMALLRGYHAAIERAIFENHGTLDKYLGDGVMATFGTPHTGPDDALNALMAARQILTNMTELNADAASNGELQFKVSVGLHYGPAILGDIGPQRRLEFAVVGDTVNVASRLEASSRQMGCHIVCSDALAQRICAGDAEGSDAMAGFSKKASLKLKGRQEPIAVWVH
jgi:adenylate cyclase